MILRKRFSDRVLQLLSEKKWTKAHLAREMQVDPPYLHPYLSSRVSPGLDVIERFANALGVDAGDLLQDHSGAIPQQRASA